VVQRDSRRRNVLARKKPTQRRSHATVEAIVSAAARVFQAHGYAGGTTNRIAERAGVSIGSLYEYFPSKDAILVAVARRHLEEGLAVVLGMLADVGPNASLHDVLERVIAAMMRLHEQNPRLHRVLFEETALPRLLRREIAEGEAALISIVGGLLVQHGEVQSREPALTAYMTVHLVETMTHRFVLYPPPNCDVGRFIEEAVLVLSRYLTGEVSAVPVP